MHIKRFLQKHEPSLSTSSCYVLRDGSFRKSVQQEHLWCNREISYEEMLSRFINMYNLGRVQQNITK